MDHRIRVPRIRVIGLGGEQLGVMDTKEALNLAQSLGVNLVEVSPTADPPVCKIIDYGKYKYEQSKRERENKNARKVQETKEIKFRPQIGDHDLSFKVRHAREFLEAGHKVKLVVQFRGRQFSHPETGQAVLDRVCKELEESIMILQTTRVEGRLMTMMVGPNNKTRTQAVS